MNNLRGSSGYMNGGNQSEKKRGRDKFKAYLTLINLFSRFLGVLPNSILKKIWVSLDLFHGHFGVGLRYCILKNLAKMCGDNVYVGPYVIIKNWENLQIGDNVSIHNNCYIDAIGQIIISDNVSIAHQSSLISFDHSYENREKYIKDNPLKMGAIKINEDVWIGCGCRILSNVTIETRAIIAAGSVVTKNVPSNSIVGGVPAKPVKKI